jgi:hypothetical protein
MKENAIVAFNECGDLLHTSIVRIVSHLCGVWTQHCYTTCYKLRTFIVCVHVV